MYLMERHPKYFDVGRELFNDVEIGKVYAVSSMLLVTEVLTKPLKDGNKGLVDQYLAFVGTFPNLGLREIDQNVAIRAAKLRARYGFKTPDALFLATAMEEKAEAFI
ncbi:MAG TPA: PIN domain-containing protein, partial [Desulfosporosinus sp.]|nr:PIN domain-containing protein [Desulfosporosinus sp.]